MTYRPLPNGLYIGASSIEGQGLYTSRALFKGHQLGESHYLIKTNKNKTMLIRTPLGGFINHSDKPNCHRLQLRLDPKLDKWVITVVEDVSPGDELTLKYTMYDPKKL